MDLRFQILGEAGQATEAMGSFSASVLAAGKIVVDFSKDSIKAFAEAERIQMQLARAAGENTAAFEAQAEAMSKRLAIEDESIKTLQTLALTYGTLPSQVGKAIEAVEDYSVITGKDAKTAMLELIKAVELGTGELDRGRIQFDVTGDSAKDMASAIEALNEKFGGAAAADADTLAGRMRQTSQAANELEEAWGGFLATVESKFGVLEKLSNVLRNMSDSRAWTGGTRGVTWTDPAAPGVKDPTAPGAKLSFGDLTLTSKKGGGAGGADAEERHLNAENQWRDRQWVAAREFEKKSAEAEEKALEDKLERMERFYEEQDKQRERETEEADKYLQEATELREKMYDMEDRLAEQHQADLDRRFQHQEEQWRRAGDRMGAALVNAIGDQLLRLAEGGDVDPAETAGSVVAAILSIAGFAIGSAYGMPQLGGAIGGLAGSLANTGIQAGFGRKKKHEGGWIERFHEGGWPGLGPREVPIIAEEGERVWSRDQVRRAGGPAAVDRMAGGAGGVGTVVINAIDAHSFLDQFGDGAAARGFFNAIRVGRGDVVPLFGG